MEKWLEGALDYIPRWLEFQLRTTEQPGCAIAVAHRGKLVFERAFGRSGSGTRLTPRHRHRVASHSKTFTTVGIMKLREAGRLRLDDPVGRYVDGLHPEVAETTFTQLLSHSAGLVRDGSDSNFWENAKPYTDEAGLRAALAESPVLAASERFKYSNFGFGLLGLAIEAVTGEPYRDWIKREVVQAAKLEETAPDMPLPRAARYATGHSGKLPLGRRVTIPGDMATGALAAATGFVSTAGDLARFFATLDPAAKRSVLSPSSRREMQRRQMRDSDGNPMQGYGLGLMLHKVGDWDSAGHGGAFQSCHSRSIVLPGRDLALSVVTNAIDGPAEAWANGVVHILRSFAEGGGPSAKTREWQGRWWRLWGTLDLVAQRDRVLVAKPGQLNPFFEASELTVTGDDTASISKAGGYASHGEGARLVRAKNGKPREFWLGGIRLVPEAKIKSEMKRRYDG